MYSDIHIITLESMSNHLEVKSAARSRRSVMTFRLGLVGDAVIGMTLRSGRLASFVSGTSRRLKSVHRQEVVTIEGIYVYQLDICTERF